jgi:hypothetical protein
MPVPLTAAEELALRDSMAALVRHLRPGGLEPDSPWREVFEDAAHAFALALEPPPPLESHQRLYLVEPLGGGDAPNS